MGFSFRAPSPRPPGYDSGMDRNSYDWPALIVLGAYFACGPVSALALAFDSTEALSVIGVFAGSASIWLVLRLLNYQDDSKRPPDAP